MGGLRGRTESGLSGANARKTGIPSAGMTRIRFDGCFSAAQAAPLAISGNLAWRRPASQVAVLGLAPPHPALRATLSLRERGIIPDIAAFPFSPCGRRWPRAAGSDEGASPQRTH